MLKRRLNVTAWLYENPPCLYTNFLPLFRNLKSHNSPTVPCNVENCMYVTGFDNIITRLTFHHYSIANLYVSVPKVLQSAFPMTCFWSLSDIHE